MMESKVIIAAVVSGVCGTALLVFVGILVYWCIKHRQDHEKLLKDEERVGTYRSYSSGQLSDSSLKKPVDSNANKSKSPMLWRKTILFAMPHKKVETVQPDTKASGLSGSPTSIETDETDFGADTDSARFVVGAEGGDDSSEKGDCKLGRINFTLAYDFPASTLVLKINNANGLPAKDFSGTSDPYVKVMLLPDKKRKMQTKIKRKTLNPRWNEIFLFEGFPFEKIQQRILYLEVLDFDRFSRDDPIGEIALPLNNVNLTEEHTYIKHLQPCSISRGKLGELLLSLCYQPTIGRITVVILKGRDLQAKDIIGTSDPYVKLWLYHGQKRVEKKKTTVKKRTLNPVFNESFIFDVPLERIRDTSIHISVMDYDSLSRNDLIGQVIIGARSGPSEMKHWNDMIAKPRQAVAQWHLLKM